ncbi:4Fe-4S binding protein [Clostridiaceae bacterium M8S5]|nr:4Fe-4S binding protein [Clostridiaceae bacterium M8S5]
MKKRKSYMNISWIFLVSFFILSLLDIRFGMLGFICMIVPLYHATRKRGRIHCSHYCPRGSFLGRFLKNISLNNDMPKWMKSKTTKHIILILMITMFSISMITTKGELLKIAFNMFRFIAVSSLISVMLGIIYKPRSWCVICPMGHSAKLIDKALKAKDQKHRNTIKV